jgi:hypothetical protein
VTPKAALMPHKVPDVKAIQRIFDHVEQKPTRYELNLYIVQPEDDASDTEGKRFSGEDSSGAAGPENASAASTPPERSPNA